MPNPTVPPPTPPPFLAQLSKAAIGRLEPATFLRDALAAKEVDARYSALIAFHSLEGKLGAAKRQQQRIARAKRQLERGTRSQNRGTVFDDIHFYVICWTRIAKLGEYLRDTTRFRRLGPVLRRYRRELDRMIQARNHLEHFEERIGKRRDSLQNPNDLFNLAGDQMSFGGSQYDIGPESMKLLTRIVKELQEATLFDSLEVLAEVKPELLVLRLRRAQQEVATDRVIRKMSQSKRRDR